MTLPRGCDLARILGADLRDAAPDIAIDGVAIDSRRVQPRDLFVALKGRQKDGHHFVPAALGAGAALVLVARGMGLADIPRLEVDDPLSALQALAGWYRNQYLPQVVAITGSNGKTVVKDALVACLTSRFRVTASPGSWNSQVGVPLAVLGAPPGSQIGVFEAGISAPGEMEAIEAILRPDYGVLVNVGLAHFAAFGSREAIAREKMGLFRHLPASHWLIAPADPLLEDLPLPCERIHPGRDWPRLIARRPTATGFALTLQFADQQLTLPVRTRSLPLVEDLLIGPTRMETWCTPEGITIINDTASSDPLSVQAALDTVAATPSTGHRRLFVFGGMADLGAREHREHGLIGRVAAERGFTHLLLLPHAASGSTCAGWLSLRPKASLLKVPDWQGLRQQVRDLAQPGDLVLMKAAAAEGLEAAAPAIWESMAPRRLFIDLGAIRENVARFRALSGPRVAILAVLKAWAYGTELPRLALALQASGVDWIGVSTADEGALARRAGVLLPILVMLMDREEVDKVVRCGLTPVVYSLPLARSLVESLRDMGAECDVHLEVDTGMGRLGVPPEEALAAARLLRGSGVVRLRGVMTHLAGADDQAADRHSEQQLARFDQVVAAIRSEGDEPLCIHAAATSAAVRFPGARYDMVRLGLGLFGIAPSSEVAGAIELEQALAFVSRLAQVAVWPRGQRVGYNGSYVVEQEQQRIGIVAAGYNDGVPWRLSNTGAVLVQGQRARILGRVSMDSMAVDLTAVPDAAVGDEVLIFGSHQGQVLRPEEVAASAGSIPYELLVNVDSRRVQRIFRND
ncbi:MAG: alanine racemase [Cyanobacteria bacterium]|nr:alanine racemase [Cyanobacteriota bacterium]